MTATKGPILAGGNTTHPIVYLAALGADTDNLVVGNGSVFNFVDPGSDFNVTGITGGVDGRVITLFFRAEDGGAGPVIKFNDPGSSAANRIDSGGLRATEVNINARTSLTLRYDGVSNLWVVIQSSIIELFNGIIVQPNQSPTTFSGTQSNYQVSSGWVRLSGTSTPIITGIAAATQIDGRRQLITNRAATTIQFNNQDSASLALNRIITGTGANFNLIQDNTMELIYDGGDQRWRKLN